MVLTQATNRTGLPVQAVEKDLWVTVILQQVFSLPVAKHFMRLGSDDGHRHCGTGYC